MAAMIIITKKTQDPWGPVSDYEIIHTASLQAI
jgi:hypothetical protein